MLRKLFKLLLTVVVAILVAAAIGATLPRPFWREASSGTVDRRIVVLSNPIHTDIAIAVDADVRDRFDFLRDGGLALDDPNLRYIIFGWGGRSFYTETPTWAELKAMPVLRSFGLDRLVMHVSLAGDIPLDHPDVTAIGVDEAGYRRLLDFIRASFAERAGKPMSLDGAAYGAGDAFFEAEGYFNALLGCNSWTAAGLRDAGLASGWWTPLFTMAQTGLAPNPPGLRCREPWAAFHRRVDRLPLTSRHKSEHFRNDQPGNIVVANTEKFIVLPYRKSRGNLVPGEMRQASNPISAEKIALSMSERFVGVAAYAVIVDEETGDMSSPRLLARHGEIADLNAA